MKSVAFDMFHGRVNYAKLQVHYARFLLEGDFEALDKFSQFLMTNLKTWRSFQVTPWLNNDGTSKLRGEHTKEFTRNTHLICEKLKTLVQSKACDDFCNALYSYEKVHCFLNFVIIDDYETANAFLGGSPVFTVETEKKIIGARMISEFDRLTSELYKYGTRTYLSK